MTLNRIIQAISSPFGAIGVFVILLVTRILTANYYWFFEQDEIGIALGVAGLLLDNNVELYRYAPQLGYYRLVQWITQALGGQVLSIPIIMITLSAISGAAIPALTLRIFRTEISPALRVLMAWIVAINPIIWMSSQYGNTAMVSSALFIGSIVLLSNKPQIAGIIAGLALYSAGILIRADTVLMAPIVALLVYFSVGDIKRSLGILATFTVFLVGLYGLIFSVDPRMGGILSDVESHVFNGGFRTHFWEHLLWATSPLMLLFAAWGIRDMLQEQNRLLMVVAVWCLPLFGFYFGSATTPRYFLLSVVPLSLCSAFGMSSVAPVIRDKFKMSFAWPLLIGVASIHLFVGLGQFKPNYWKNIIRDAQYMTHDGPMHTGGFLYQGFLRRGFLGNSLLQPGFGKTANYPKAVTPLMEDILQRDKQQTVAALLVGWNGHLFHFYAQAYGAEVLSRKPRIRSHFISEIWYRFGKVTVMSVSPKAEGYRQLEQFPVAAGDEVWVLGRRSFPKTEDEAKVPPGLRLRRISDKAAFAQIFQVESDSSFPSTAPGG